MPPRRQLFAISMIVDVSVLHAVTSTIEGHAFDVVIKPVAAPEHLNGVGKNGRTTQASARTVLMPWLLQQKGEITSLDAVAIGDESSLSRSAVYTLMTKLMHDGTLKRIAPGRFVMTAAGRKRAAKAQGSDSNKRAIEPQQRHEIKHTDFTLKLIKAGTNSYKTIRQAFAKDGRVERSVDGALGKLKQDKLISSSGPGQYKLLAKGEEYLKA